RAVTIALPGDWPTATTEITRGCRRRWAGVIRSLAGETDAHARAHIGEPAHGPAAVEERQVAGEKPPGDRPCLGELGRRERGCRCSRRAADDRARRAGKRGGALMGGTAPG